MVMEWKRLFAREILTKVMLSTIWTNGFFDFYTRLYPGATGYIYEDAGPDKCLWPTNFTI